MTEYIDLDTPLNDSTIEKLKAGDKVRISGILYTARDAAHKRLIEMVESGEDLPFDLKGQLIYYVGPTPARPGQSIGSAGPTTMNVLGVQGAASGGIMSLPPEGEG